MEGGSKILIIGGTGYIGKYMVKASVSMGHTTYIYARPKKDITIASRAELLEEFQSMGVGIFEGYLNEREKLVSAFKSVDVVISTLAIPQHEQQYEIMEAIKEAGNIKRFIPSEFGCETDKACALPPFQKVIDKRRKIRRAVEASGIPYTFITANCYGTYFIDFFLHPRQEVQEVVVYGTGQEKAIMNYEGDIAAYTIMVVNDPRTLNRVVNFRLTQNIISQLQLISLWEKKTGKNLQKTYLSEEQAVTLSKTLPFPEDAKISVIHNLFIKGDLLTFDLGDEFLDVTKLFPDYKYTTIGSLLDMCLAHPPKINSAAF